jgi:SAM-dependent methyltransferase
LGYRLSQALHVAAQLRIADLLSDGAKDVAQLAHVAGAHAPSLRRLLRVLASEGVFVETAPDRFELTPLAALLRSDVPDSLRERAVFDGEECNWRAWGQLLHSVTTGAPAFAHAHGAGLFEYLAAHPAAGAAFDRLMAEQTAPMARAVAGAYDFADLETIVDVGGGHGVLVATILAANPDLRGILFDQPHVVAAAGPILEAAGVAGRCAIVAGDFFAAVPEGGDACLLKFVLHDWDDERARRILQNCRRALPASGRLLVVECLVPPANESGYARYLDLNMLVLASGRERSEQEYATLFAAAGFALARIVPTRADISVIEGRPV